MRGTKTILSAVLVAMACGGGEAPPEEEASTTASAGAEDEPVPGPSTTGTAWEAMTHEQQGTYMAQVVVPEMEPLFQAFDAEEFAGFGCATCHGEDAQEVGFEMPNGLHPMTQGDIEAMFESDDPEVSRWATFMASEVKPQMASLLGLEPWGPENPDGFGCFGCHENAGE